MKKILIADDTKNIRQLLTTYLEHQGYDVITAENGITALTTLQKENFDLAFLDIKMPKMSGTEVLRQIRNLGINTPIVIITAFPTVKNAIECTQMGAIAYMQKPFTINRVKQILEEIISSDEQNKSLAYLLNIAEEKLAQDCTEEALTILKKALSIEPTHDFTYYLLSVAFERKGDSVEAERFRGIYKLFQKKQ